MALGQVLVKVVGGGEAVQAGQVDVEHRDVASALQCGGQDPVAAVGLLDRLINTSHQVFMNGPSYRPNKSPRRGRPLLGGVLAHGEVAEDQHVGSGEPEQPRFLPSPQGRWTGRPVDVTLGLRGSTRRPQAAGAQPAPFLRRPYTSGRVAWGHLPPRLPQIPA